MPGTAKYSRRWLRSFAVPVITILLAMVGIVMLLISSMGSHQQARVFVQVQQPEAVSK